MTEMVQGGEVVAFDADKREFSMRVVPWGVDALTQRGYERFEKGAFEGLDPSRFVLRQRHQDPPTGRGVALEEADDWLLMTFKVAQTQHGDEQIALYRDGVETGVSVGFEDGEKAISKAEDGRQRITHKRVKPDGMLEVSTTYIPAFRDAAVLQYRERVQVAEQDTPAAEVPAATPPQVMISRDQLQEFEQKLISKVEKLDEKVAAIMLGAPAPADGAKAELTRQVKLQVRELADVITTGNEGVVPDAIVNDMIGRVDTGRPFLNGTRRLPTPEAGTRLLVPRLTQSPLVDEQESEKAELASRATVIDTVDYPMITAGGAGDLSMQLIRRSSPSFLNLWLELLGQAYATYTEDRAVDALLAEAAVVEGGDFDPAAPLLGDAFTNAVTATGRTMKPDRIFLSTAAIAAFMDAVEPAGGGGRPLYPGIASIAGIGGEGSIPGSFTLQPIWTPALDDEAVDIIVGPSQAFAWAEDGTYTLQADVPSKFGRDVGLAGMIWYAPLYPAAFTTYTLAS
jgi:HK97 family phage prohead protease